MTEEELKTLPSCLLYQNPGKSDGCRKHPNNDDDWDELDDPCENCSGRAWNWRNDSLEDAQSYMAEHRKFN